MYIDEEKDPPLLVSYFSVNHAPPPPPPPPINWLIQCGPFLPLTLPSLWEADVACHYSSWCDWVGGGGGGQEKICTPTKRQVSKRQVSKRPVSKRLKRQVYKTSGLPNVRFTKFQVYKTSGLQNVRLQKNIHVYILYLWLVEINRFCCSHVCRQSDGCVLFSILEGFLPYITIMASNK